MLGIRPVGYGFREVEIRPMRCGGRTMSGELIHPSGRAIKVDLNDDRVWIELPPGLTGHYCGSGGAKHPLKQGFNEIVLTPKPLTPVGR